MTKSHASHELITCVTSAAVWCEPHDAYTNVNVNTSFFLCEKEQTLFTKNTLFCRRRGNESRLTTKLTH